MVSSNEFSEKGQGARLIKVLHIIATLQVGGAERQLLSLLSGIDRNRFEPIVVALTRGGFLEDSFRNLGIPMYVLHKKHKLDFSVLPKLVSVVKEHKPQVLHSWMFTANTWGRLTTFFARVPVVLTAERNVDDWKTAPFIIMDRILASRTTRFIANSNTVKEFLVKRIGLPVGKIEVIYNGVETDISQLEEAVGLSEISGKRESLGIEPDDIVVGDLCRMDAKNGVLDFVLIANEILRKEKRLKFLLIGGAKSKVESEYEAKVKALVSKLAIEDKFIFFGFSGNPLRDLRMIDILLHPSIREGMSNSIMEAMLLGIPVVATTVGGTPELVRNGLDGYLISPNDHQGASEIVVRLAFDREKRRELGGSASERVKSEFSREKMIRNYMRLYEELTAAT